QSAGLIFNNRGGYLKWIVAGERNTAGEHFIKDNAKRENICAFVQGLASELLGRHIGKRSHYSSVFGQAFGKRISPASFCWYTFSKSGVDEFHMPSLFCQDVSRWHIWSDPAA